MKRMKNSIARLLLTLSLLPTATVSYARTELASNEDLYLEALKAIQEKRVNDARASLNALIVREPEHAGAWLELAIIHCEIGDREAAQRLFDDIRLRFNPSTGIQDVMHHYETTGCDSWKPQTLFRVSLDRGYDSNVNQGTHHTQFEIPFDTGNPLDKGKVVWNLSPDYLHQADNYSQLALDYGRDLNTNGGMIFAQFRARRNDNLRRYNFEQLLAGIEQPWRIKNQQLKLTVATSVLSLENKLFQKQFSLSNRWLLPVFLNKPYQLSVNTSVSRVQYLTSSNYDSTIYELRGNFDYQTEDHAFSSSASVLKDDTNNSRRGYAASLSYRRTLYKNIFAELNWNRQEWRGTYPYTPGFIDQIRHQRTNSVRAALSYPLHKNLSLKLDLRRTVNKENISIFEFNGTSSQLGLQWQLD